MTPPAPAVYALRPAGSVSDLPDVPHLTGIRNAAHRPDAWEDVLRLDWLDRDGQRYAIVGRGTTVPGVACPPGYHQGTAVPGWYPDCWKLGTIHPGTPYERGALVQIAAIAWWPGRAFAGPTYGSIVGLDMHPSYGGATVGMNSAACQVWQDPAKWDAVRSALIELLHRTGRVKVGYALVEVPDGHPALVVA